jgi:hypothetical protein
MPTGVVVPFAGGSYAYRARGVSVQRSINFYPENIENALGKSQQVLVGTPGSRSVLTVGSDATATCRGMYYSSSGPGNDSCLYTVYGLKVYRITRAAAMAGTGAVEIGSVIAGSGVTNPVSMTDNGFVLVVADGTALYSCDLFADDFVVAGTWQQVDLPFAAGTTNPILPSQVVFLNQRLIINCQGTNQFYFSNLASTVFEDSFGVQNFYSAESSADAIRTLLVCNNRLWIFGDRSYEVWSASGGSNSDPFGPLSGYASQIGVQGYRSPAAILDKVFWLGSSDAGRNLVMFGTGLENPTRISTNALEYEIGKMVDADTAVGWCYTAEGHTFYVLTFQSTEKTFVYDLATQLWHERSTHDWTDGVPMAWEPLFGVTAFNSVYHGSALTNRVMTLDSDRNIDADGKPLLRQRVAQIFYADFDPITLREFYLDMEVGTTPLLEGHGSDPKVMLEISRDGGQTWEAQPWKSFGLQGGYYYTTVKWTNLGVGRAISARITFSEPVPVVIYGARVVVDKASTR